ncbi:MAG: DegT/DnrJ/EryC1/StrS aminotransferase family protein [Pseudomonadota bacterium]
MSDPTRPAAASNPDSRIPIAEPSLGELERRYVREALESSWISSRGGFLARFEQSLAQRLGLDHALATTNGTAALHLALAGLGIGPGDDVVVPDLTFAATANAVFMAGARPVLADCAADHFNADAASIARALTPATKAVIVVHLLGQACRMEPILDLARDRGLVIVEDCAEALTATCGGRQAGSFGAVGCFSFFANKVATTGEGGAVATADPDLAQRLERLRAHGMDPERHYWHDRVGYNYRMTNLSAALGLAQLERLDDLLARRRALAQRYAANLAGLTWLLPPFAAPGRSIDWLHPIWVDENALGCNREQVLTALQAAGIDARPMFHPLHLMPPYEELPRGGDLDQATRLGLTGLLLPLYPDMGPDRVDRVCERLAAIGRSRG